MKASCFTLPRLLLLLTALLFASASDARAARRTPKLYTFGADYYELGEVRLDDAEPAAAASSSGVKVGYRCQAFGLFWVNIWTWKGEFCLYKGSGMETKKYQQISQEDAAKLLGVDKISKPWNYSFPPGMLIIIGLIGLKVVPRLVARRKAAASAGTWQGGAPAQPAWTPTTLPDPPAESYAPPLLPVAVPPPIPPPLPPDQR